MSVTPRTGSSNWEDLKGKTIAFKWSDGWDDYDPRGVFSHTQPYTGDDPRYPKYYIMFEDGGGYSVFEDEEVEVEVEEYDV